MRKILYTLPLLGALALASCDEVSENDRYIEAGNVDVTRAVLVEDFTGQNCINCPKTHEMIEKLEEQYGDNFIAVSIHAGSQSISTSVTGRVTGLATATGEEYDKAAAVAPNGYPTIIVDGHDKTLYKGTGTEWIDAVRQALQQPSVMEMSVKSTLTEAGGKKEIHVNTMIKPTANVDCMLQVWIVEDGVVARQTTPEGRVDDYVHNNVFRAAVNGTWGDAVDLKEAEHKEISYVYTIEGDWENTWNTANLKIVAFCYTKDGGVLQATRAKVVTDAEMEE